METLGHDTITLDTRSCAWDDALGLDDSDEGSEDVVEPGTDD
ncbi:hypothetical protein ACWGQ5_48865 [Streptomyces sp. NPDC055722]